jgi:hypothetical protein
MGITDPNPANSKSTAFSRCRIQIVVTAESRPAAIIGTAESRAALSSGSVIPAARLHEERMADSGLLLASPLATTAAPALTRRQRAAFG